MNFIWWRIQVDWIARGSLSNYSPLHFPIVLFKSSLLAFPKFSSTYLLGFCSNCLLLCSGFNKYLKISKISNDIKLWFSSIRWKARLLSVLMHLFFFVFVSIFVFVFVIVFYVERKAHKYLVIRLWLATDFGWRKVRPLCLYFMFLYSCVCICFVFYVESKLVARRWLATDCGSREERPPPPLRYYTFAWSPFELYLWTESI